MKIEKNKSLKEFNTFKVGGDADYFCRATSVDELKYAVLFAKQKNLSIFILGNGSNILVSDDGFKGLVIKIEIKKVSIKKDGRNIFICAGAGENWDDIVQLSVEKGLYGIENMSFIPGTIGAGAAGNIGAYGNEIKDVVEYVEVLDIKNLKTFNLKNSECKFKYRDSVFKKKNFIITKVCLKLFKDGKLNISYKDIQNYFKANSINITLIALRRAVGNIRDKKFPDLNKYGTAGSFFKNPIIDGNKMHLAKILDDMGLKGYREGNTELYKNQPLIIVNLGNANAKEIKKFADNVAQKVFEEIKIKIAPEIIFVGKF